MRLSVGADADFQKPEDKERYAKFFDEHRTALHQQGIDAAKALLAGIQGGAPVPQGDDAQKLLPLLDVVLTWDAPPEVRLLEAKLRMPAMIAAKNSAAALTTYIEVIAAHPELFATLQPELDATVLALHDDFQDDHLLTQAAEVPTLLAKLPLQARSATPRIALLESRLAAESAKQAAQFPKALETLLALVKDHPDFADDVKPDVVAIINAFRARPAAAHIAASGTLTAAGNRWKLDTPFMILAEADPESKDNRWNFYREAAKLGNNEAKAEVGGFDLFGGIETARNPKESDERRQAGRDTAASGLKLLREAVDAGNPKALYLLATAYFEGKGVGRDFDKAAELARQAVDKGHRDALVLLGNSQLGKAQEVPSPGAFAAAAATLEQARAKNLPNIWYSLYLCYFNDTDPARRDPKAAEVLNAKAAEALQKGAQAEESRCLYNLGLWLFAGQSPLEKNQGLARDYLARAARRGLDKAREWCLKYERAHGKIRHPRRQAMDRAKSLRLERAVTGLRSASSSIVCSSLS